MSEATRVSEIAAAASVLRARAAGSLELFVVRRAAELRFFGGFHAFPGGKVNRADAELAGDALPLSAQKVAAIRELFEEIGVLLAHDPDGRFPEGDANLTHIRAQLNPGRLTFPEVLPSLRLSLRLPPLTYPPSLVTPGFTPIRFD